MSIERENFITSFPPKALLSICGKIDSRHTFANNCIYVKYDPEMEHFEFIGK